jgi:hypothetical protein
MARQSDIRGKWPRQAKCRLCGGEGSLGRSHIIPKFVGEWLKATNGSGRLRDSANPNRLIQDITWRYMLCTDCEERFAKVEAGACTRIFMPLHATVAPHDLRGTPSAGAHRRTNRSPRRDPFHRLAVRDDRHAVHNHVHYAERRYCRLAIR